MLRRSVAAAAISIVFLAFLPFEVSAAFVPKQTGLSSFNIYDPVSEEGSLHRASTFY